MLVLEGPQGYKKSMTFDVLGGAWFTETPLVIGDKDSRMVTASKWVVELAELASMRRGETEAQKAFLSARTDDYRVPYGRAIQSFDRRCVFGGTTNEVEYLQDHTGNRRWWCARVTREVDVDQLRRDRDQLWAEAVARFAEGERWWHERDEQEQSDAAAAERMVENEWVDPLRSWWDRFQKGTQLGAQLGTRRRRGFTLAEAAEGALGIKPADLKKYGRDLARAIREAGFERSRLRVAGSKRRLWVPVGSEEELEEEPHEGVVVDLVGEGTPGAPRA